MELKESEKFTFVVLFPQKVCAGRGNGPQEYTIFSFKLYSCQGVNFLS